ncbi:unnamed protein product [Arabidopsis halleri]
MNCSSSSLDVDLFIIWNHGSRNLQESSWLDLTCLVSLDVEPHTVHLLSLQIQLLFHLPSHNFVHCFPLAHLSV